MTQKQELPPISTPESFVVNVLGLGDTAQVQQLAYKIHAVAMMISRYMDLSRLDGITAAVDYDEALRSLDRGFEVTQPLTRTKDNIAEGVGMAPIVLRGGVCMVHLVMNVRVFLALEDTEKESSAGWRSAFCLLAHECGHVSDMLHFDQTFPDRLLKPSETREEGIFFGLIYNMWQEYAASRLAGPFYCEDMLPFQEELVMGTLSKAHNDNSDAIIRYRSHHGDVDLLLKESGKALLEPVKYLSYLLGYMDGLNWNWDLVPSVREALDSEPIYGLIAERLHTELRCLWDTRNEWSSLAAFDPLQEIAKDLFAHGGLHLSSLPDGSIYVDVP